MKFLICGMNGPIPTITKVCLPEVILDIYENWYLVNIVHNNFQEENGIWRLFDLEIDGGLSNKLRRGSGSL